MLTATKFAAMNGYTRQRIQQLIKEGRIKPPPRLTVDAAGRTMYLIPDRAKITKRLKP